MSNKKKMLIFIVCYFAYTLIYVARLNLSVASPSFIEEEILDKAGIGFLGSAFSVVYSFGRLINGYISDRKSPQLMISVGLIIVGISNILMGTLPGMAGLLVLWSCNAYAQSMLWGPVLKVIASIYDEKTAKKKTAYMVTSVATGNIVGILLNTVIINNFGFRYAFVVPGILTFVFCFIVIVMLRGIEEQKEEKKSEHMKMLTLFKDNKIKRVLFPALFHGMIKDNISVWMTVYFVDKFNINLAQTAGFVLFIPIVGFIGRMAYPLCYKLCGYKEHKVSVYAFLVSVVMAGIMCLDGISPILATVCLSALYAAVSIANTTLLSIFPLQFAKSGNVASVSGIMDFATYFGAGISSFAYGIVIKAFGYLPMYGSWVVISIMSILILKPLASNSENNGKTSKQ